MSETPSFETKEPTLVAATETHTTKVTHKKNGRNVVLLPQPSDDSEDPLVHRAHASSSAIGQC